MGLPSFILNFRNGKAIAKRRRDLPHVDSIPLCPGDCKDGTECTCVPKKNVSGLKKKFLYDATAPFQLKNAKSGLAIVLKCAEGVTDIRGVTEHLLEDERFDVYQGGKTTTLAGGGATGGGGTAAAASTPTSSAASAATTFSSGTGPGRPSLPRRIISNIRSI